MRAAVLHECPGWLDITDLDVGRIGPHEVLVTAEVVSESDGRDVTFEPVGPIELTGVAAPAEVFRAASAR